MKRNCWLALVVMLSVHPTEARSVESGTEARRSVVSETEIATDTATEVDTEVDTDTDTVGGRVVAGEVELLASVVRFFPFWATGSPCG